MISLLITSFVLGLAVSLHCAGMCGPLVCAKFAIKPQARVRSFTLMQLGRLTTYGLLGCLAASMGEIMSLGSQQARISIVVGVLILIFYFLPRKMKRALQQRLPKNSLARKLRRAVGVLMKSEGVFANYGLGLLNGLLPCGVVYAALAASAGAGTTSLGGLMMIAFGLGNIPVLILSVSAGMIVKANMVRKFSIPLAVFCTAGLLILRGMDLGIPYVSPTIETQTGAVADCCANK